MTGHRARGVLLYSLAAVLLVGGLVWFFRAAPRLGPDPRLALWQVAVAQVVPDLAAQVASDTIVMGNAPATRRSEEVNSGSYTLTVVCAAEPAGRVRVRLSAIGTDSGRAVQCAEDPTPVTLTVALADTFVLFVSAETGGQPAVFRWRLSRASGY